MEIYSGSKKKDLSTLAFDQPDTLPVETTNSSSIRTTVIPFFYFFLKVKAYRKLRMKSTKSEPFLVSTADNLTITLKTVKTLL